MGSHSLAKIIPDVDMALKALEIFSHAHGAAFEGLSNINGHRRILVGEGESVSWGGARNKDKGRECELTKNIFFHSDMLNLCLKKNPKINQFFPDTIFFTIKKLALRTNDKNIETY